MVKKLRDLFEPISLIIAAVITLSTRFFIVLEMPFQTWKGFPLPYFVISRFNDVQIVGQPAPGPVPSFSWLFFFVDVFLWALLVKGLRYFIRRFLSRRRSG